MLTGFTQSAEKLGTVSSMAYVSGEDKEEARKERVNVSKMYSPCLKGIKVEFVHENHL